jgi:uncharacterized protein (TIGR02147 family)
MTNARLKLGSPLSDRPDIHRYQDYRSYLRDLVEWRRRTDPAFSFRSLAQASRTAVGYLSTVLAGKLRLTAKAIAKLGPALGLSEKEMQVLSQLVDVTDGETQNTRAAALEKLERSRDFRENHPQILESYRYLSRWYYVAIREMAALPNFKADPSWIQRRLRGRVPLANVSEALRFLLQHGYLEEGPDGKVRPTERDARCEGEAYRVALGQFHRTMLSLASESLLSVPRDRRLVLGHTLSIAREDYDEVRKILEDALDRIALLEKRDKPKGATYQVTVAAFPLTTEDE